MLFSFRGTAENLRNWPRSGHARIPKAKLDRDQARLGAGEAVKRSRRSAHITPPEVSIEEHCKQTLQSAASYLEKIKSRAERTEAAAKTLHAAVSATPIDGLTNQSLREEAIRLIVQLCAIRLATGRNELPKLHIDYLGLSTTYGIQKRSDVSNIADSVDHLCTVISRDIDQKLPPEWKALNEPLTLSDVYERLIGTTLYDDQIKTRLRERKKHGQFYTPFHLAYRSASIALESHFNDSDTSRTSANNRQPREFGLQETRTEIPPIHIVDPAMGTGIFLLAALLYIETNVIGTSNSNSYSSINTKINTNINTKINTNGRSDCNSENKITDSKTSRSQPTAHLRIDILRGCLFGVDIDPLAKDAASLMFWLYCTDGSSRFEIALEDFAANFRCADSLLSRDVNNLSERQDIEKEKRRSATLFHYDKEFPQVFPDRGSAQRNQHDSTKAETGFDIVLSNPPWELAKPNSQEFFSSFDTDYRRLKKQEAVKYQEKLFKAIPGLEQAWNDEKNAYRNKAVLAQSGYEFITAMKTHQDMSQAADFNSSNSCTTESPGSSAKGASDLNVYRLFLELGFNLLKQGGRMAMLVPTGICSDKGAVELRRKFLSNGRLLALHTFNNSDKTFNIHRSFNYCLLALQRGGSRSKADKYFTASFNNTASSQATAKESIEYAVKDISIISPKWLAVSEVPHGKDLTVLTKIRNNSVPLGASGADEAVWNLKFKREFDMTNDSHQFVPVQEACQAGFRPDIFNNWIKGKWQSVDVTENRSLLQSFASASRPNFVLGEDRCSFICLDDIQEVLLPLYEGRMIGQFDFSEKLYANGTGRTAEWLHNSSHINVLGSSEYDGKGKGKGEDDDDHNSKPDHRSISGRGGNQSLFELIFHREKRILPQFLLPLKNSQCLPEPARLKVGYLAVGSPTNVRTMIASALHAVPCGNSVPVLLDEGDEVRHVLSLVACLNSFVFDYFLRMRMTGNNLNYYLLEECCLPPRNQVVAIKPIAEAAAFMNMLHPRYAKQWIALADSDPHQPLSNGAPFSLQTDQSMQIRSLLEAMIAHCYRLTVEEFAWILRGCDQESSNATGAFNKNPKGFFRVHKSLRPSERLTTLSLKAYERLIQTGFDSFLVDGFGIENANRASTADSENRSNTSAWGQLRNISACLSRILM
jgi:hypothetical protein